MVFTYATPIFYPGSILPETLKTVIQFNPMYQYITFFRTIVINGISPEPMAYIKCMAIRLCSYSSEQLCFGKRRINLFFIFKFALILLEEENSNGTNHYSKRYIDPLPPCE